MAFKDRGEARGAVVVVEIAATNIDPVSNNHTVAASNGRTTSFHISHGTSLRRRLCQQFEPSYCEPVSSIPQFVRRSSIDLHIKDRKTWQRQHRFLE